MAAVSVPPLRGIRRSRGRRRMSCRSLQRLLLLLLAVLFSLPLAIAQPPVAGVTLEHSVKAAFLYKFSSYVEWPRMPSADRVLTIGVIGADDVAHELSRIAAGRTVNDRSLAVKRIGENDSLVDVHILFIGAAYNRPLDPLLRNAQQNSVLTVTERDDALAHGSVINFKLVDGRVRFDVSLPAAEKSNLKLSSRMLAVAHQVQKGPL